MGGLGSGRRSRAKLVAQVNRETTVLRRGVLYELIVDAIDALTEEAAPFIKSMPIYRRVNRNAESEYRMRADWYEFMRLLHEAEKAGCVVRQGKASGTKWGLG